MIHITCVYLFCDVKEAVRLWMGYLFYQCPPGPFVFYKDVINLLLILYCLIMHRNRIITYLLLFKLAILSINILLPNYKLLYKILIFSQLKMFLFRKKKVIYIIFRNNNTFLSLSLIKYIYFIFIHLYMKYIVK